MKDKTALFIGHRNVYNLRVEFIMSAIRNLYQSYGVDTYLNGGMGIFDTLCKQAVNRLKAEGLPLRHILVTPYHSFSQGFSNGYDEIQCLHLTQYTTKDAFQKRNDWMIENASYAICHVRRYSEGAGRSYMYAKQVGIFIVDLP